MQSNDYLIVIVFHDRRLFIICLFFGNIDNEVNNDMTLFSCRITRASMCSCHEFMMTLDTKEQLHFTSSSPIRMSTFQKFRYPSYYWETGSERNLISWFHLNRSTGCEVKSIQILDFFFGTTVYEAMEYGLLERNMISVEFNLSFSIFSGERNLL